MGNGSPGGERPHLDLAALIATSVRRERERAGLSVAELAGRAGIAESALSRLESGAGTPGVETLWALAVELGVPLGRLVDPPRPRVHVIRAGEGPATRSDQADYAATLLASCPLHARRDLYRMQVHPGRPRLSEPHLPGTVEHVVLGAGRALAGPAGEPVEIGPGDYVTYPGDAPHVFEALEPGTTAVIVMEYA
ncbi:helix-turn-helix domain-containing protein [Streptomyces sp. HB2AG]|uniref:helix-turn-helix domain-containing protein n=1 Tax=Streptomyces sp. HB2AG TaxID=2983400 RepID=UPI0022AA42D3|nr:XRE family transcriptional regulator [Streptomyces sp. HB2AG]MCZ2524160.1 XRE family transcriptional regulator [Streptomyces sp. HB2AG]